jgi:hypothetical protein
MKTALNIFFVLFAFTSIGQTDLITQKMNNTVYVTCDSTGTPILKNGKAYYFIFDATGKIDFRAGADVTEAINSSVLYTGTWANIEKKVFWEWTESKKTGSAMYDEETTNLKTKSGIIYRFIGKY